MAGASNRDRAFPGMVMVIQAATSRRQRLLILSSVVVVHLVLLVAVMTLHGARAPSPVPRSITITLLSAQTPASGKPPPPALPSKLAQAFKPLAAPSPTVETAADASSVASDSCAPLDAVTAALLANDEALTAVRSTPPEARSIADAVVIWNARWSTLADDYPQAPLRPTRTAIEQSLASFGGNCLDQPVTGPRLIPIPDGDRTMFLVVGSGIWRWHDLLQNAPASAIGAAVDPAVNIHLPSPFGSN